MRFGLISYRDRGDEYVTRRFDLTEDIDAVYEHLQEFKADGGGDGPESVNQALHEAVTKISWDEDRSVTKIIFLVGDAPPHMDYEQDVKYPEVCKQAVRRDLIINTIQCGQVGGTRDIWEKIAHLAEGKYVAIGQSGDMRVMRTPYDKKLAELNKEIGQTMVPYGELAQRRQLAERQCASEEADTSVGAERAAYSSAKAPLAAEASVVGTDLTEALVDGRLTLDKVDAEQLPEAMQEMSDKEAQGLSTEAD